MAPILLPLSVKLVMAIVAPPETVPVLIWVFPALALDTKEEALEIYKGLPKAPMLPEVVKLTLPTTAERLELEERIEVGEVVLPIEIFPPETILLKVTVPGQFMVILPERALMLPAV